MSHPTYPSKENFIEGFTKDVSRAYRALSMMVRSQGMGMRGLQPLTYSQAYDRVLSIEENQYIAPLAFAGAILAPVAIPTALISYPLETITVVGIADNLFMGGTAPNNISEFFVGQIHDYNPWAIK